MIVHVKERVWLMSRMRKKAGLTPAGIIHSSLLYDNGFAGETKGSRALRAVAIRSACFTTATFSARNPRFVSRVCKGRPYSHSRAQNKSIRTETKAFQNTRFSVKGLSMTHGIMLLLQDFELWICVWHRHNSFQFTSQVAEDMRSRDHVI